MTYREAIEKATPSKVCGIRYAIARPFPDVTFIAGHFPGAPKSLEWRVRGIQYDMAGNEIDSWEVEQPERMTIGFEPLNS